MVEGFAPRPVPYKLVYKSPLRYKSPWFISPPLAEGRCPALTKFVWRTDHLHSKSLCYKSPPREGHLSRTGHIGGTYKPVYTVCQHKVGRPLAQGAGSCFSANYVLDIRPVGRLPDDPRPDEFVVLDEFLLHYRRQGRRQPERQGLDLPSVPAQLGHACPVIIGGDAEMTLVDDDPV
jgi:hypothetical protein